MQLLFYRIVLESLIINKLIPSRVRANVLTFKSNLDERLTSFREFRENHDIRLLIITSALITGIDPFFADVVIYCYEPSVSHPSFDLSFYRHMVGRVSDPQYCPIVIVRPDDLGICEKISRSCQLHVQQSTSLELIE